VLDIGEVEIGVLVYKLLDLSCVEEALVGVHFTGVSDIVVGEDKNLCSIRRCD
jgi:hypothetical protein